MDEKREQLIFLYVSVVLTLAVHGWFVRSTRDIIYFSIFVLATPIGLWFLLHSE